MLKSLTALTLVVGLVSALGPANARSAEEQALVAEIKKAEAAVQAARADLDIHKQAVRPLQDAYSRAALTSAVASSDHKADVVEYEKIGDRIEALKSSIEQSRITLQYEVAGDLEKTKQELAGKEKRLKDLKVRRNEIDARLRGSSPTATGNTVDRVDLGFQLRGATDKVRTAQQHLADAQGTLARAHSKARWHLEDLAPPFLYRVRSLPGSTLYDDNWKGYYAEWTGGNENAAELLRLAHYLHQDLGKSIKGRRAAIERLDRDIEQLKSAEGDLKVAYKEAFGIKDNDSQVGYWVNKWWDSVQLGLIFVPHFGAQLIAARKMQQHQQVWGKILIETADAGANVAKSIAISKLPAEAAVGLELVARVNSLYDGKQNPTWNVEGLPNYNDELTAISVETMKVEQAPLERINYTEVLSLLEKMRPDYGTELVSREFETRLARKYSDKTLAASFMAALLFGEDKPTLLPPKPESMADLARFSAGSFLRPADQIKPWIRGAAIKAIRKLYEAQGVQLDKPALSFSAAAFAGMIQAAVKRGALSALAAKQEIAWNNYALAHLDTRFSQALRNNEGRFMRIDQKIRELLADEVIPKLMERYKLRNTRELKVERNQGVAGKRITLILEFTRPVVVDKVSINGESQEFSGEDEIWQVSFSPAEIAKESDSLNTMLNLAVDARDATLSDRPLDDPSSIANWSKRYRRFENDTYDPGTDTKHKIRLAPYWPADVQGSNRHVFPGDAIAVTHTGNLFMGTGAWVGIFPEPGYDKQVDRTKVLARRKLDDPVNRGTVWFDFPVEPGLYEIVLFDSAPNGKEVARFGFRYCAEDEDRPACSVKRGAMRLRPPAKRN